MKRCFIFIISILFTQVTIGQSREQFNLKLGVNADYSFSGSTNTLVLGPAIFWEKEKSIESRFFHTLTLNGGFCWSKDTKIAPVTSAGYYFGNLPGLIFGISSQQYYNVETKYNNFQTDVRLSGELILALFGFIGYRYQYPLLNENEAKRITRHAIFFRIPIPVKGVSKK